MNNLDTGSGILCERLNAEMTKPLGGWVLGNLDDPLAFIAIISEESRRSTSSLCTTLRGNAIDCGGHEIRPYSS